MVFSSRTMKAALTSSSTSIGQLWVCSLPILLSSVKRPGVPTTSNGLFNFRASACPACMPRTIVTKQKNSRQFGLCVLSIFIPKVKEARVEEPRMTWVYLLCVCITQIVQ